MKIALFTIHRAANYGAVLQAIASQLFLSRFGQTDIADYRNEYNENSMRVIRECKSFDGFKSALKDAIRFIPRRRLICRFEQFIAEEMRLVSTDSLKEYDVFVSGSDQIWNPNIISGGEGFDEKYFLEGCGGVKVSLASSFGDYKISGESEVYVKSMLSAYTAISIRESGAAADLEKVLGREVLNVLDPTLLLSKEDWLARFQIKDESAKPYILVYALKKCNEFNKIVDIYRSAMGVQVVVIDQDPSLVMLSSNYVMDAGPLEFLKLFYNAQFVITNSFHGVAFSVNFEVPFVAVKPVKSSNRVTNFLQVVNMMDRYVADSDSAAELVNLPIDFEYANRILTSKRKEAENFLTKSIY